MCVAVGGGVVWDWGGGDDGEGVRRGKVGGSRREIGGFEFEVSVFLDVMLG